MTNSVITKSPIKLARALYALWLLPDFMITDGRLVPTTFAVHKDNYPAKFSFDDCKNMRGLQMLYSIQNCGFDNGTFTTSEMDVLHLDNGRYSFNTLEDVITFARTLESKYDEVAILEACERLTAVHAFRMAKELGRNYAHLIEYPPTAQEVRSHYSYLTPRVKMLTPDKYLAAEAKIAIGEVFPHVSNSPVEGHFEYTTAHKTYSISAVELGGLGIEII